MRKHLDLFSGIGGFALASEWVWPEIEHTFCDIEPFSQANIKKNWPHSKIYGDIKTIKGSDIGPVDLVTGGFPCQPFSSAGNRRGTEDDRHLWPEMLRVIREVSPRWIIGENVSGLVTWDGGMVLEQVCSDLEATGYEVWPLVIPACAINAPHRRDRVWILANNESFRRKEGRISSRVDTKGPPKAQREWSDFWFQSLGGNLIEFRKEDEPFICGMDDGLPDRVDRLKGCGNAIVPQVAYQIMKAIKEVDEINLIPNSKEV